jgi:hypothetical protein
LAVTGQHLLAGAADPGAIGLQAAEDGEHVVLAILMEELLAIAHNVGMASGALLIGAGTQADAAAPYRWRLWGQLSHGGWSGEKQKSDRYSGYAYHSTLFPGGIPPAFSDFKTMT